MKMQIIALLVAAGMLIGLGLPWVIAGSLYTKNGFHTNEGFILMNLMFVVLLLSIYCIWKRFRNYTRFYLFTGIASFILCLVFMVNTYVFAIGFDKRYEYFNNINKIPVTPSNAIGIGVYLCCALSIILLISAIQNKRKNLLVMPSGMPPLPIQKIEP